MERKALKAFTRRGNWGPGSFPSATHSHCPTAGLEAAAKYTLTSLTVDHPRYFVRMRKPWLKWGGSLSPFPKGQPHRSNLPCLRSGRWENALVGSDLWWGRGFFLALQTSFIISALILHIEAEKSELSCCIWDIEQGGAQLDPVTSEAAPLPDASLCQRLNVGGEL